MHLNVGPIHAGMVDGLGEAIRRRITSLYRHLKETSHLDRYQNIPVIPVYQLSSLTYLNIYLGAE